MTATACRFASGVTTAIRAPWPEKSYSLIGLRRQTQWLINGTMG